MPENALSDALHCRRVIVEAAMRARGRRRAAGGVFRNRPDHLARAAALAVEVEEPFELRVVPDRLLEPEDRNLPLRLEREMDEIKERLSIDCEAVVIALEVACHREDGQILDAFPRPDIFEELFLEGIDANRRREEM